VVKEIGVVIGRAQVLQDERMWVTLILVPPSYFRAPIRRYIILYI